MKNSPYKVWGGDIESEALGQMDAAMSLPVSVAGALMPDAHVGYGLPIGGVLATENSVIPYGVGVDIACRVPYISAPRIITLFLTVLAILILRSTGVCQTPQELNNDALEMSQLSTERNVIERAVALLDSAIAIDPLYDVAYSNKISILCRIGDKQRALKTINSFLKIRPERGQLYVIKGNILEAMEDVEGAKKCYRRAMAKADSLVQRGKASPNDLLDRAFLILLAVDKKEGIEELERLQKEYPNEPLFLEMMKTFKEFDHKGHISNICGKR